MSPRLGLPRLPVLLVVGLVWLQVGCSASPSPPSPTAANSSTPPSVTKRLVQSAEGGERLAELPVGVTASASSKRVLFSEKIVVRPGEIILAVAEFQVTNDLGANIFVGSQVVVAKDSRSATGLALTEAGGQNVTPDMHHGQFSRTGILQAEASDAGDRWVNVVVWASSSRASPGAMLRVDHGYGRLTITSL